MAFAGGSAWLQNILFVDDNDNITDNSDTMQAALAQTIYSNYTYWNVADSSATPESDFLGDYDVVIWYTSTDGVGLGFRNAGTGGDSELITYFVNGGKAWIIGTDILYAGGYDAGDSFAAGDFAYDFMGLQSYNVQSYGDDGSQGVPGADRVSGWSWDSAFPGVLRVQPVCTKWGRHHTRWQDRCACCITQMRMRTR